MAPTLAYVPSGFLASISYSVMKRLDLHLLLSWENRVDGQTDAALGINAEARILQISARSSRAFN